MLHCVGVLEHSYNAQQHCASRARLTSTSKFARASVLRALAFGQSATNPGTRQRRPRTPREARRGQNARLKTEGKGQNSVHRESGTGRPRAHVTKRRSRARRIDPRNGSRPRTPHARIQLPPAQQPRRRGAASGSATPEQASENAHGARLSLPKHGTSSFASQNSQVGRNAHNT